MDRYNIIKNKNQREIVLLQSFPCAWGKCKFCDYILDNSTNENKMIDLNQQVLAKVTGEFGVLEVINSGSCFELPKETLSNIRDIVREKQINKLYFESHWIYRNRLDELRKYMGVEVLFKIGVETFDFEFREHYLNKHADFVSPVEVSKYFDSVCLMVGIKGQTKAMIANDIDILKEYFKLGTINVYTDNTTDVKKDQDLINWFINEYEWLQNETGIEVLYVNTDFGVGD